MAAQLDLSILETVKDPDLRASIERLGMAIQDAPKEGDNPSLPPAGAKIIQSRNAPGVERHGAVGAV